MSLGGLGAREGRRASLPLLPIFSGALLLLGFFQLGRELISFSSQQDALQDDVRVAGIQVGGLSEAQAQDRWEEVYLEQPIKLVYNDSPILLSPESIGFRTNNEAMLAAVRGQSGRQEDFWAAL
ncbi:MAG: hypothetical protein HC915_04695 [Anaerolineae bacterium]|nr:hypothetical protein [Anaerolineae bacterium]